MPWHSYLCVYFAIMMSYTSRFQKQHILLGGIWFSEAKPPMNSFLRPLLSEINELQKNGKVYEGMRDVNEIYYIGF